MRAAAFLVTASCLAVPVGAQVASPPPVYDIREIPVPQGSSAVLPTAVGNDGTVAGYALGGLHSRSADAAFRLSPARER